VEGKEEGSSMIDTAYCYMCDQDVDVIIKKEAEVHNLKGADVSCEVENIYCQKCGAQVYIPMINDRNLDCINLAYRKQHGIITIHEIEELLDRYDIGAKPLANLLGWGEVTIIRYLKGQIPDRIHSDTLITLNDPREFANIFEKNRHNLTEVAQKKVSEALRSLLDIPLPEKIKVNNLLAAYSDEPNIYNGFTKFDLEKLIQVILYFALLEGAVYVTKMNKLLWYSDMLHYKRTGNMAITGLSYKHNYHGPTPKWYDFLYGSLEDVYITLIDDEFGTKIIPIKDESTTSLSEEEMKVLDTVAQKFRGWNASRISDYSHKEKAYRENSHNDFIPFAFARELSLS
jgi:hypothetical protein